MFRMNGCAVLHATVHDQFAFAKQSQNWLMFSSFEAGGGSGRYEIDMCCGRVEGGGRNGSLLPFRSIR